MERRRPADWRHVYGCKTCGTEVQGLAAAGRHAKQGHKTQRDAFHAGQLHSLALVVVEKEDPEDDIRRRAAADELTALGEEMGLL